MFIFSIVPMKLLTSLFCKCNCSADVQCIFCCVIIYDDWCMSPWLSCNVNVNARFQDVGV
jgi:hypothetical protein